MQCGRVSTEHWAANPWMLLIYIKLWWELWFKALSSTIKRATISKPKCIYNFCIVFVLLQISKSSFQPCLYWDIPPQGCNVMSPIICKWYQKTKHIIYIYTVFLKCFLMSDVQEKIYIFVCIFTQNLLSQSLQSLIFNQGKYFHLHWYWGGAIACSLFNVIYKRNIRKRNIWG